MSKKIHALQGLRDTRDRLVELLSQQQTRHPSDRANIKLLQRLIEQTEQARKNRKPLLQEVISADAYVLATVGHVQLAQQTKG